jgi:hypothetical protein
MQKTVVFLNIISVFKSSIMYDKYGPYCSCIHFGEYVLMRKIKDF